MVSQDPDDPQKAGVEKNGVPRNAEEYEWLILFDSHRIARSMAEKWGSNEVAFHDFCIRNHNKKNSPLTVQIRQVRVLKTPSVALCVP